MPKHIARYILNRTISEETRPGCMNWPCGTKTTQARGRLDGRLGVSARPTKRRLDVPDRIDTFWSFGKDLGL